MTRILISQKLLCFKKLFELTTRYCDDIIILPVYTFPEFDCKAVLRGRVNQMKCKTCGATLDEYDDTCPFCGTPVDDQVEEPVFEEEPKEEPKPRISSIAEKYMKKSAPSLPKLSEKSIVAGAVGVAVLLSLISLIVAGSANGKANTRIKELQSEISSLQASVDAAYSKANSLEGLVYEMQSQAAASSSSASQVSVDTTGEITKAPSDEFAALNREDVWMFSVEVKSTDDSFTWQKYNESTGEWVNVPLTTSDDGYSANWEKKDSGGVKAKLIANKITNASFGKYRCMITTSGGTTLLTSEAALSQG